ncbi:MAG: DUF4923 family protein [Prevotellaceae bacterium]|nr:DUF4923 family protein [Prevotellaceae bacterium]
MKKIKTLSVAVLMGSAVIFGSCGLGGNGTSNVASGATAGLGLLSALTGGGGTLGNIASGASNAVSLASVIGNVIGSMTTQSGASIVGTWVYSGPTVEFESSNLLAQAGGAVAGQTVASKLSPYFEKLGIKPGAMAMQFNQDGTCAYVANNKQYNGTYTYDASAHTLYIKGATSAISFPACNVSVNATSLNLTFKTSALLNAVQSVGSKSGNSTISTISTLANQFNGMQTGFQFTRQ